MAQETVSEKVPLEFVYNAQKLYGLVDENGEVWFNTDNVAGILMFPRLSTALRRYVTKQHVLFGKDIVLAFPYVLHSSFLDSLFLNVEGLSVLIQLSKITQPDKFKEWVRYTVRSVRNTNKRGRFIYTEQPEYTTTVVEEGEEELAADDSAGLQRVVLSQRKLNESLALLVDLQNKWDSFSSCETQSPWADCSSQVAKNNLLEILMRVREKEIHRLVTENLALHCDLRSGDTEKYIELEFLKQKGLERLGRDRKLPNGALNFIVPEKSGLEVLVEYQEKAVERINRIRETEQSRKFFVSV